MCLYTRADDLRWVYPLKDYMDKPQNEIEETLEELYQAKLDAWNPGDAPIKIVGSDYGTGETIIRDTDGFTRSYNSNPMQALKDLLPK